MDDLIKAVMADFEAEVATPNALQTHLTAANAHLVAAMKALQEEPKTDTNPVSEREVMELINQMW